MRNYVLAAYDISDPRRLRRVHKTLRGYGDGFQDSVFLCQLSEKDEAVLREKLRDCINHCEDQVVLIRLSSVEGNPREPERWEILGRKPALRNFTVLIY